MKKKTAMCFAGYVLSVLMLAGCGNQPEESPAAAEPTNVSELADSTDSADIAEPDEQFAENPALDFAAMDNMISEGEMSGLVGVPIDTTEEEAQQLKENGNFQCLLNSEKQVMSIAIVDPALCLYGISPQSSLEEAIEALLLDQWSYKAEYVWYSESNDTTEEENAVSCYQSGVFEKDHFEYIVTTNTEENYGTVCAVELIDTDMFDQDGADDAKETVFARLHGLL